MWLWSRFLVDRELLGWLLFTGYSPRNHCRTDVTQCAEQWIERTKGEKASVEAFTRIQIDPFCRCCVASGAAASVSGVAGHRKTGLDTGTRGFVAFCGNNQQVVAKQGYECISSAVNTVARRVPQPFFCHDFSLKRCRFYALGRAASRMRGKKDEGQGPDFR